MSELHICLHEWWLTSLWQFGLVSKVFSCWTNRRPSWTQGTSLRHIVGWKKNIPYLKNVVLSSNHTIRCRMKKGTCLWKDAGGETIFMDLVLVEWNIFYFFSIVVARPCLNRVIARKSILITIPATMMKANESKEATIY